MTSLVITRSPSSNSPFGVNSGAIEATQESNIVMALQKRIIIMVVHGNEKLLLNLPIATTPSKSGE